MYVDFAGAFERIEKFTRIIESPLTPPARTTSRPSVYFPIQLVEKRQNA